MVAIWKRISTLGIDQEKSILDRRTHVLTNQLNFVLFMVMLGLIIITSTDRMIHHGQISMGSIRVILFAFFCLLNIILAARGFHRLIKPLLIFLPPLILIILPTLTGFIENESFVYYPYVIISFSIIPQLILLPSKNKILYWSSMIYYFILIISIDFLLRLYTSSALTIIPIIESFYIYYKASSVSIFLFLNLSVFYLRSLNEKFEAELTSKTKTLDLQNEELKTTLQVLKTTQNHLIQSEKMAAMGNFISGISHEINNPLNFISGGNFLIEELKHELKEKTAKPDELLSALNQSTEMIQQGVDRISQIVQKLAVSNKHEKSGKAEVDLNEVIDTNLFLVCNHASKPVEIVKDYQLTREVVVHKELISQVFFIILLNAIEAIESDARKQKNYIHVHTLELYENEKNHALIEITNSGPAIDNENLLKVFDPFFTTKEAGKGTGLGLAIAYSVIREHQGKITVKNTEQGVLFRVQLPISHEQ